MPETTYEPPEGFRTMAQAAAQIGVSLVTLRKLVQRTGVELYQDPRDARAKLLRTEDIDRISKPTPIKRTEGKAAA
jgi:hypothetical protein